MMEDVIRTVLRLLEILWTLLTTALIGNVIALNINAAGSASAAVNYTMFTCVVAWIAALYGLVTNYVDNILVPIVSFALDGAATLFTFIAAVVLSAKLRVTNCGGRLDPRDLGSDWIGFGSADNQKRCREIQASAVFLWFLLACFVTSLFFTFRSSKRTGKSVLSGPGSMSQVRGV
ncbi:hypothetical protein PspLS_03494 [Pyricularia sp. CBS 133598]|nr:hypothetical protein PspLS_03494 [Pyricularia sp. CBS 133598]